MASRRTPRPSTSSPSRPAAGSPPSASVRAELTSATISARRDASTKRRSISDWAACSPPAPSTEGHDHDGMVAISFRASDAADFPTRVHAGERRNAGPERVHHGGGLDFQAGAEHVLAPAAIED